MLIHFFICRVLSFKTCRKILCNPRNRRYPQPTQCKWSRRVGPGDRHPAALSAERKTRMGQQGGWHKGMSGQGCHVMPGPKGRRAERRNRAKRGARTARHRAPSVGDYTRPLASQATPVGDNTEPLAHCAQPSGYGPEALARRLSYLQSSLCFKPAKESPVTPETAVTRSQHNVNGAGGWGPVTGIPQR